MYMILGVESCELFYYGFNNVSDWNLLMSICVKEVDLEVIWRYVGKSSVFLNDNFSNLKY